MSLTLSCILVEVFAMICAVLLQNRAQVSVALNPAFSVALIESLATADLRHGALQSWPFVGYAVASSSELNFGTNGPQTVHHPQHNLDHF